MSLLESPDTGAGGSFRMFVATFTALDPYLYGVIEHIFNYPASYLPTYVTIENEGELPTWPIWSIDGAFTRIVITNYAISNNPYIDITHTAHAGDTLYVDTRPRYTGIYENHVTNCYGKLSTTSDLFPLARGINKISFIVTGTIPRIQCKWVDRFNGV